MAEQRQSAGERFGRWFARFATVRVVERPWLWKVFRRPLRWQFDRLAPVWDARRGLETLAPLAAALDRVAPPARLLDIGTGTGKAVRLAAERFPAATAVGVDLSPAMVAEARRLLPEELASRVELVVADAAALPFGDAEFQLVILLNMIPFFPELARVTAPGGTAVLAFSAGAQTPIYVPPATLQAQLQPLGFDRFEELAAGAGTAILAHRRARPA